MVVEVYISSTSGNTNVKSRQQYIMNVLSAAKIPFEVKDISSSETYKQFMQKVLKDNGKTPIAPQLFFGSEYLGDYEEFIQANENEMLFEFLKVNDTSRASSVETES
ncbi:SH3 domain-binding glutamic acid-rich-like protein isoform 1 [Schistosoma japonicum]|uniref:SH3 domain-binding glutamic acid-rich-like protein n=1 Tax=Schistosoma japonicum TaxID=6182 RepID=Q5DBP5_SCHJA|nr:SJCHGC01966 protein [Schistosoma japonicum]KAH8856522.1 sh3 domain-binding glutamic acid-rich-like protein [Schistosoma japonicum]TNN11213.1 SH3 domain-binding glutamic acid-rich-like protein isoform 1 [Schistosoma japonicum]